MTTAYVSHASFQSHQGHDGHPECPERLAAIERRLRAGRVFDVLQHHVATKATRTQVRRVHTDRLLNELEQLSPAHGIAHVDPDTFMNTSSLDCAWLAAGGAVKAVELVMQGHVGNAFAALRPPGHHAERDKAMGFCLINNVAVAAASALEDHDLKRVAIVDFDVHHGNGTEDIFGGDERVLVCSTFQHPFYPHSGVGDSAPNVVNVPLSAGTGSDGFRRAVLTHWIPALTTFEPEMLFISAGFDAHTEDHLAQFELTDQDFAWVTLQLVALAERYSESRVVSCLEGGYALDALARSVEQHLRVLIDASRQ